MDIVTHRPETPAQDEPLEGLVRTVSSIIEENRGYAVSAINYAMVREKYGIGQAIVEDEQGGAARAAYGAATLSKLSERLTAQYGKGYSAESLRLMRKFFLVYSREGISQTLSGKSSAGAIPQKVSGESARNDDGRDSPEACLSWSHYVMLMGIDNPQERHFYEVESARNGWSLKELKRQFDSALYERLALSRDKEGIKALTTKGQTVESPLDAIKDPYVLEFLDLPEEVSYSESELETRIIDHLQEFLLELGAGFTFVGRQVRISYDEDHYYIDLVFFNRLLRCFVLFDLKIGELRHQDLGQMQMYVHYYDRKVKLADENPTVGVVLCKKKKDSMVEMTLPEDNRQIFASKYLTVLPSKEDLRRLLDEADDRTEGRR